MSSCNFFSLWSFYTNLGRSESDISLLLPKNLPVLLFLEHNKKSINVLYNRQKMLWIKMSHGHRASQYPPRKNCHKNVIVNWILFLFILELETILCRATRIGTGIGWNIFWSIMRRVFFQNVVSWFICKLELQRTKAGDHSSWNYRLNTNLFYLALVCPGRL